MPLQLKRPSSSLAAAVLAGLLLVLVAAPDASADLFGGDVPLLGTLVSQGAQQLSTATQVLRGINEDVASAQRMVAMATEARNSFTHFAQVRVADFGKDGFGLAQGTVAVSSGSRLSSGISAWAPATGELQPLTNQCATVAGSANSACRQMHTSVSPSEAQTALTHTFGLAHHADTQAGDYEASRALSAADTHTQQESSRAAVSAASRNTACASGGDSTVCALAQTARQESQLDTVNEQLAEGNRLRATHLALQNAERKRSLEEAGERRDVIAAGWQALQTPSVQVTGDGVNLVGGR